jgi:hypothetical protein
MECMPGFASATASIAVSQTTPVALAIPRVFALFHAGGAVNRR